MQSAVLLLDPYAGILGRRVAGCEKIPYKNNLLARKGDER
jgi:hypothetical protein